MADLQTILRSLGRDPNEAVDLLQDQAVSQNKKLSFQEFLKIMKSLEDRLMAANNEGNKGNEGSPTDTSLEERIKYGSLLPRTGVHFLPDSKVVDFLKLLNDYRKKCIREMNLSEAVRA